MSPIWAGGSVDFTMPTTETDTLGNISCLWFFWQLSQRENGAWETFSFNISYLILSMWHCDWQNFWARTGFVAAQYVINPELCLHVMDLHDMKNFAPILDLTSVSYVHQQGLQGSEQCNGAAEKKRQQQIAQFRRTQEDEYCWEGWFLHLGEICAQTAHWSRDTIGLKMNPGKQSHEARGL